MEISRLLKKNKFGKNTYYLLLDSLHRMEINETTNDTYIVDFLELGIIWDKNIFSFSSSKHILDVVSESMDKIADYYRNSNEYNIPEQILIKDKNEAMEMAYGLFKR